jgi:enterochelin esterase-like enzyme
MRILRFIVAFVVDVTLLSGASVQTKHQATLDQQEAARTTANIETLKLTSKVFNNTRTIRVLLPPGYHKAMNKAKRYPVFYFNDGIMVFSSKPTGVRIEEVVYGLYKDGKLPPLIMVGVDNGASTDKTKNAGRDRADEFLPYPDTGFSPGLVYDADPPDPHGKLYPDFLLKEVMPVINSRYRTRLGQANTNLAGFSYGGVSALYIVMSHPHVFGKLLLESTPLWIGPDYQLLKDAEQVRKWPDAVCFGSGTNESDNEEVNREGARDQDRLVRIIAGQSPRTRIKIVRVEGAQHQGSAWHDRLSSELQFLFPTRRTWK